jgi:hypothetical protein
VKREGIDPVQFWQHMTSNWQIITPHTGGAFYGKHVIPFGKSGNMGDALIIKIIQQQNELLKVTKQCILQNVNDMDEVIEMPVHEDITFSADGQFSLREAFMIYKDNTGNDTCLS